MLDLLCNILRLQKIYYYCNNHIEVRIMYTPLEYPVNPTDKERHEMLMASLERAGRPEDYDYILKHLSPPQDITAYASPGSLKDVKIGILGGGVTGLCAAFELRKLGADITVLEALSDRIGGRVYTYYFDHGGRYYGEFGAMRVPASHETTWHYLNLFGLGTLRMIPPRRNNFLYVHNTRLRTSDSIETYLYPKYDLTPQERNTPYEELSQYAFEYLLNNLSPSVRSELIQSLPKYSPELYPLMNLSLRQTLEQLGLSQGAISLLSGVNPSSGALLDISYDEILTDDYTLDNFNTYTIDGGSSTFPYAFYQSFLTEYPEQYAYIPKELLGTVQYKAGHYVTGIYQSDYRQKVIIKYINHIDNTASADIFDYIICTLPFSTLRLVEIKPYFNNMKMQAIAELNYINAQKTLFLCNKRFWEKNTDYGNMIGGVSFTDLPIQGIFYPNDHNICPTPGSCSPKEPGVLLASYGFEQNATRVGGLDAPMRYELVRQNVEEVHGLPRGFLYPIVDSHKTVNWNQEAYALGALALTTPGQKPLFSYEILLPEYNNHVYFAGEHISSKHGWLQGALYTGKAAANDLAYHFTQSK